MLKFLVAANVMIIFLVVTTRALRRSTMGASDDCTVGLLNMHLLLIGPQDKGEAHTIIIIVQTARPTSPDYEHSIIIYNIIVAPIMCDGKRHTIYGCRWFKKCSLGDQKL